MDIKITNDKTSVTSNVLFQHIKKLFNDNNNLIERRNSRFFLQSPHCAGNCFQRVRSSDPGAIIIICVHIIKRL